MKNHYLHLLIAIVVTLLSSNSLRASHIVGGEVNYRCLGNDQYEVSLTVYRDCAGAPFDDPAELGVYYGNGTLFQSINIPFVSADTLDGTLDDPCLAAPPSVCIERTTYVTTVTLPFTPDGYTIVYQRCCRNGGVTNIVSPNITGATYYIDVPAAALTGCNNSPVFNDLPNIYLCQYEPINFDHSVTDLDGDSIVYDLYTPYNGGSSSSPSGHNPPPYSSILWQAPYSQTQMLGTTNPLTIDPVTGVLSGTPGIAGIFLVGVIAREYRNGVLLSETRRDFQYAVGNCQPSVLAAFDDTYGNCNDLTFQIINNGTSAIGSFFWDLGVLGTSTDENPIVTFPSQGMYPVTLIAGLGTACADTFSGVFNVEIQSIDINITGPQFACIGDSIWLKAEDIYDQYTTGVTQYTWGPPNQIASGQGTDSVLVIAGNNTTFYVNGINANSCQNTAITLVQSLNQEAVYDTIPIPTCNTSLTVNIPNPVVTNPALSDFYWQVDNLGTSNDVDLSYTFPDTGSYDVVLFVGTSTTSCGDTFYYHIDLNLDGIVLGNLDTIPACSGDTVLFTVVDSASALFNVGTYNWTSNAPIIAGQGTDSVWVLATTSTPVTVSATNNAGCSDNGSGYLDVEIAIAAFDSIDFNCNTNLEVTFNNTSQASNNNYLWIFDTLGTSTLFNPTLTFPDTGTYTISLIAGVGGSCADTTTIEVNATIQGIGIEPLPNLDLCKDQDPILLQAIDTIGYPSNNTYTWFATNGNTLTGQTGDSIFLTPTASGASTVFVTVTNVYGCSSTTSFDINVANVTASFDSVSFNCLTSLSIPFDNLSSSTSGVDYLWLFDTLGTSTDENPVFTFPDTGSYEVTLIADAGGMCPDTLSATIDLLYEGIDLQIVAPVEACAGDSVWIAVDNLLSNYASSSQYNWTSSGTVLSPTNLDSILVTSNSDIALTVIGENNYACKDTATALVSIIDVTAAFNRDIVACNTSLDVNFTNSSTTNDALTAYDWDFGGLGTSTNANTTFTFPDTGTYAVQLIVEAGNLCTDTLIQNIQVAIEGLVLDALSSATVCEEDSVWVVANNQFEAYAPTTQYLWSPAASIITGQNTDSVLLTPTAAVQVELIAVNGFGCADTVTTTIDVIELTASFNRVVVPCNTSFDVAFDNNSTTNNTINAYNWDFAGLGTAANADPTFTFPDTGTYAVQLVVEAGNQCTDTLIQTIQVAIEGVQLTALNDVNICEEDSVIFTTTNQFEAYAPITQYNWSPAAAIVLGQGTNSVLLTPATGLQVQLIASNAFGCMDTVAANVIVNIVDAAFDSVTFDCNTSLEVPFQNSSFSSPLVTSYEWSFGTTGTSTQTNPSYTFADTGTYIVQLIADAGGLCPDTFSRAVIVPLTGLEISATGAQVFCRQDTALLTSSNLYDAYTDFTTYEWEPAAWVLSGQGTDSVQVQILNDTAFTVIGTNSHGCKDTIQATTTIMHPSPVLSISTNPDSIFVGQMAQLTATDDWDYTYNWQPNATLSDSTIYNPESRPRQTTTYYLTVTNQYGCQTLDSVTVLIRQPICDGPLVFVPNAFSPDGDGYNDVLMVEGNNIASMTMMVYNRWGQKVFETNDQSIGWDGTYQGKALPPGVYAYYMQCTCSTGGNLLLKGSITLLK